MADIVMDTNILSDMIAQYYEEVRDGGSFKIKGYLNANLVRELNKIVRWNTGIYEESYPGLVTASSLAFVEIARKFDEIARERFTFNQFAAFIDQPPEWFFISAVDKTLFLHLNELPGQIQFLGKVLPIEWTDAIHMATATSRDEPWLLAITDPRMRAVHILKDKII